jgi:hypothetical protein
MRVALVDQNVDADAGAFDREHGGERDAAARAV